VQRVSSPLLHFEKDTDLQQALICAQLRERYRILHAGAELDACVSGRFRHKSVSRSDYPAVGDVVTFELPGGGPAVIHDVLPRRGAIMRKAAGTPFEEQVIAANVDTLFIVCGLDGDFNVRRIERYCALARSSNAEPVLILNKADVCRDLDEKLLQLADANVTIPVHVLSALLADGLQTLEPYLLTGTTIALAGSSGVGKSTITNALLRRNRQRTSAVRDDDARGRHTTTVRQLFALPTGAFLIDTPGMRELHLWASDEALGDAFDDIERLARACKFSDCAHQCEPGCAVRAALGESLTPERLENYRKLQREQAYLERKVDARAAAEERERWKTIHRNAQEHVRFKRRST
jgi:ribosome biogenesis GTPase / thiamine phosphate phosphatase